MSPLISLEVSNHIAVATLNRPDQFNCLDLEMLEAIMSTADTIKNDRSIRVVILRGAGKAFCAGLNVSKILKNPSVIKTLLEKTDGKAANILQEVSLIWRGIPVPVIAVTHGYCYGGGFQIALGSDFRYSTPDCKFSVLEGKWGLIPDMGISVTLRELVPIDVAKELTMTARTFDATEAKALNLVTKVTGTPFEDAMTLAKTLTEKSPDALVAAKKLYNQSWLADDRTALDWETKLQGKMIGSINQLIASSRNFFKWPKIPYLRYKKNI